MPENLKPFKREGCPKCGSGVGNIILSYCEKAHPARMCWSFIDEEHLHHHCRTCSYEWMTACKEKLSDPPKSKEWRRNWSG